MVALPKLRNVSSKKEANSLIGEQIKRGRQINPVALGMPTAKKRFATWDRETLRVLKHILDSDVYAKEFRNVNSAFTLNEEDGQGWYFTLQNLINAKINLLKEFQRRIDHHLADPSPTIPVEAKEKSHPVTDREAMELAIALAKKCRSEPGKVSPKVGAVLVRDGVILDGAYRGELKEGEHAEYTLLERKLGDEILAGATLFTTLEPCTTRNHPKVPCAQRISDRKIAKVFIGTLDRNENIRGRGEFHLRDVNIQVGRFDSDLMSILEELNRDFIRDIRERTGAELKDPIEPDTVGPNGFKIGYNEDGDKVEWIEEDGELWPMILRRNDNHILAEYAELQDRVWYVRKLIMFEKMEKGEEERKPEQEPFIEAAIKKMKKMEEEYGAENLVYDDIEWGRMQGKMAALAWVMGSDWDSAFDT
jgi:pyrimidine deaminase RibD-like protein